MRETANSFTVAEPPQNINNLFPRFILAQLDVCVWLLVLDVQIHEKETFTLERNFWPFTSVLGCELVLN